MSSAKHSKSVASSSSHKADETTIATTSVSTHSDNSLDSLEDILLSLRATLPDWTKWKKQLKARKKPVSPLRKLLGINCLFWALPTSDAIYCSTIARLVQLKSSSKGDDPFDWVAASEQWLAACKEQVTLTLAVEAIAWAHALPNLATRIDEEAWSNLLASLLYLAQPAQEWPVENEMASALLRTELAISLAYSLPEIPACKKQFQIAAKQLESTMDSMLDGEGMPHAKHLHAMHLLLATTTRTLAIDEALKKRRIGKNARLQFDWLCRQTLRWTRPDGSLTFAADSDSAACPSPHFDEMMKSALQLTSDASDLTAYKLLRGKRKSESDDTPEPAEHSEWSCLATMRTTWLPKAARLAVSYSNQKLTTEFAVGSSLVFSGPHNPMVSIDGDELTPESAWEEVCWESDEDMDFVELDMRLSKGWRIQRQLLLAREDSFALISDSLIGPNTADIRYRCRLPLVPNVSLEQPDENTEAYILGEQRMGTIIPLSLPEWKTGDSSHRFRLDPAGLEIQQRGRGLYAPLFIDFDPARKSKALTWRTLTVAESLRTVAPDVATAFRVQIGKQQWVIYRSVAKPGNRTFLGQNLICEFLVARFDTDGQVDPIIEVST